MNNTKGKNIHHIPATKQALSLFDTKRVALYCRVSSTKKAQLHSLSNQISGLAQYVRLDPSWRIVDIYIDYESGADDDREGFKRMLADARLGRMDIVIVKAMSRLGRDTVTAISACRELKANGCDVFIQNRNMYFSDTENTTYLEIGAAMDQEENENRAAAIRWGINRGLEEGTSGYLTRPFYGYRRGEDGELYIYEDEAIIVRMIFKMYLSGASIVKIKQELDSRSIKTPTGKEEWPKRTIEHILKNTKYCGIAYITAANPNIDGGGVSIYESTDNNPPIIPKDTFFEVMMEMKRRSNVSVNQDGTKVRKGSHYSAKRQSRLKQEND